MYCTKRCGSHKRCFFSYGDIRTWQEHIQCLAAAHQQRNSPCMS